MKKFLATLLALVMLMALAAPALAEETPTVTYYVRGGTAQYEPYIYPGLVGLLKIQQMAGVNIEWTVVCGNGDEIQAQHTVEIRDQGQLGLIRGLHLEYVVKRGDGKRGVHIVIQRLAELCLSLGHCRLVKLTLVFESGNAVDELAVCNRRVIKILP